MDSGELITLGLYIVQQLGVMLGVGAATVTLIAQLVSTRDSVVDAAEARFARFIDRVMMVGLLCMIISGVTITAFHSLAGELSVIFTPAYLFKWLLIVIVALPLIIGRKHPFPPVLFAGFIGATWYALFILHVIAPIANWVDLVLVYLIWVAASLILWSALARLLHAGTFTTLAEKLLPASKPALTLAPALAVALPAHKPATKPVTIIPTPKPKPVVPTVTQAPKPIVPVVPLVPVVKASPPPAKPHAGPAPHKPAELPPPHVMLPVPALVPTKPVADVAPTKPAVLEVPTKMPVKPEEKAEDPDQYPGLPAIRVMPRTPEDVDTQHRATVVQFS